MEDYDRDHNVAMRRSDEIWEEERRRMAAKAEYVPEDEEYYG